MAQKKTNDYIDWLSSGAPINTPFYVEFAFMINFGKVTDIDKEMMLNALDSFDAEMNGEYGAKPVNIYRLHLDGQSDALKDETAIMLDDYCVAWELGGTFVGQKHYAVRS